MLNKAILIGRLGKDPETQYTSGGLQITKFTVATNEKLKDGDRTEWHNVTAFGKLAKICGEYLRKGRQVYIEGSLRTDKWQDQSGQDRYTTEVIASEMQMLGGRADDSPARPAQGGFRDSSSGRGRQAAAPPPEQSPAPQAEENFTDDDIPF